MLPARHELSLLLTNTILSDLTSQDRIDIQQGLVAACKYGRAIQYPLS